MRRGVARCYRRAALMTLRRRCASCAPSQALALTLSLTLGVSLAGCDDTITEPPRDATLDRASLDAVDEGLDVAPDLTLIDRVDAGSISTRCTSNAACESPTDAAVDAGDASLAPGSTPYCEPVSGRCVACLSDTQCPPGNLCMGNRCAPGCNPNQRCPEGLVCCQGACLDTLSDVTHCGACDNTCSGGQGVYACVSGQCTVSRCNAPFADCDGSGQNGCEVNLVTSAAHCGGCNMPCATRLGTQVACVGGTCQYACEPDFFDCDADPSNGCEANLQTSVTHCGACGVGCASEQVCVAGVCRGPGSCAELRASRPSTPSGVYRIDPDGEGGADAFDVYCEMSLDRGGYTLVGTIYNTPGGDTRSWAEPAVFTGATTFGALSARTSGDFKSPAWASVPGRDLLVVTDEYHFGFHNLVPAQSLAAFVSAQMPEGCSERWVRSGVDVASDNLTTMTRRGLGFAVLGRDLQGEGSDGCRSGASTESGVINFAAGPEWWVFGVGNCRNCGPSWSSYDNGMLALSAFNMVRCSMDAWPCNDLGLWWSSSIRPSGPETKTRYVQLYLR